jgi:hypothetical protein
MENFFGFYGNHPFFKETTLKKVAKQKFLKDFLYFGVFLRFFKVSKSFSYLCPLLPCQYFL